MGNLHVKSLDQTLASYRIHSAVMFYCVVILTPAMGD